MTDARESGLSGPRLIASLRDGIQAEMGAYPEGTPLEQVSLSVSCDQLLALLDEINHLREKVTSLDQDLSDAGDELRSVWDVLGKVSPADAEQLHEELANAWLKAGREGEVKLHV